MDLTARSPLPRLLAVQTAYPPYVLRQEDVAKGAGKLFARVERGFDKFAPVYMNAAIETRHSSVPIEWYLEPHGFGERNRTYVETALTVLQEAAEKALAEAGLQASDIDAIVCVSSSGIATPSLDTQ